MPLILPPKSRKMDLREYVFSKFPGGACLRPKYPSIIATFPAVKNFSYIPARLSRRLKLSEKESMQVLIEGLLPDLQCHVSLGRPKTIQGAISLACIKDVVNQRQGVSDSQALFTQMQTMFKDLMAGTNAQVVAATATPPPPPVTDKRVDELSTQVKQLQKQLQQQSAASLAAYDQPPNPPRSFQSRNWQGQPTRQVEQLQRQVNRL